MDGMVRLHIPEPYFTASHDGYTSLPSPTKMGPQPSGRQVPIASIKGGGLGDANIRVIAAALSFAPLSSRDCPVVFKYDGQRFKYGNVTTKLRRNVLYELTLSLTAVEEEAVELWKPQIVVSGSGVAKPVVVELREVTAAAGARVARTGGGARNGIADKKCSKTYTGEWLCDCGVTGKKNIRDWLKLSTKLRCGETATFPLQVKVYGNLDKEKARGGFVLNDIRYELETSPGVESGLRKCFYIPWMSPDTQPYISGAHMLI